jgi:spermidine synthase
MNSFSRSSEEKLSQLAVDRLGDRPPQRVLIAGLGMGFTLRALLDRAPPSAQVTVAELNPVVVEWCRGPLGPATDDAILDKRVHVEIKDVAEVIAGAAPGSFDLILLDLYEGPNAASQSADDPFYGPAALARTHRALAKGGVAGIWSEDADAAFAHRFGAAGFAVTKHSLKSGASRHVVYLGRSK